MDGAGESNNNSKVLRRGLEDEDSTFTSMRSSLRARRDRLARREALLQTQEKDESGGSTPTTPAVATPDPPAVTLRTSVTRNSAIRRSRLPHEYSEPQVDTHNDETALSLITSSKILSMDDSTIKGARSLAATTSSADSVSRLSQRSVTPTDLAESQVPAAAAAPTEGESGAMNSMRKSLPANMRSRRTRRELAVDEDMRTRTPSREIINNDINGLLDHHKTTKDEPQTTLVNGSASRNEELRINSNHLNNGSRRRSQTEASIVASPVVVVEDRTRSNSDFNGTDTEKPSIERTTSGSTNMSAGAVPGETREERIARYKEMRKAALAARTTQYLDSGAEDNTTPVSGYVPRYLRNKEGSGANYDRSREDDAGSGYVPRSRRRYNNEDNDIASSSNASSMTDLHVTRKDSSASSDNSTENGPCKLTYENLKLHDKLSSAAPPYSSLSRLEESPTIAPIAVEEISKTQSKAVDEPDFNKYSHRKESANDTTPTNSPALATRSSSKTNARTTINQTFSFDDKKDPLARRLGAEKKTELEVSKDNHRNLGDKSGPSTKRSTPDRLAESAKVEKASKGPGSVSDSSDMAQQYETPVLRRGSMGLSDRLKKFEAATDHPTTPKSGSRPGKLDISRFSRQGSTDDSTPKTSKVSDKLHRKYSPSESNIHSLDVTDSNQTNSENNHSNKTTSKVAEAEDLDSTSHLSTRVERRKRNALLNDKEPRQSNIASEEPLLDPQLAAMLEARKIKAGESPAPVKDTSKKEVTDVTSILKSRMRKREETTISVAARASFFKEEQKRVAEPAVIKAPLDRHPSAKIPQVDQKDSVTKRAIGVKRAMLSKKRARSATQPITMNEFFAAKALGERKHDKTQDDLDLPVNQQFRGRLLSVPTTDIEILEVKRGSPPQKYVRPKERKPREAKRTERKTSRPGRPALRNVTAKVDSGKSVLSRNSANRSSVRNRDLKPELTDTRSTKGSVTSLIDSKVSDQPTRFTRRSASVRVSGSAANGVKAAAERAHAMVEARKAASAASAASVKRATGRVGDAIRARATAKVDSRRSSTNSSIQMNGNARKLSVKVGESASAMESCPLSPASTADTASTTDKHNVDAHRPRKLSASTVNSEDVPSYMRLTAAAQKRDRHSQLSLATHDNEDTAHQISKRRSSSTRDLESGQQPSYMKPTNSFVHRVEAKLDDLAPPIEADTSSKPRARPISLINQETGVQPSFMRSTTSSSKKLEKVEIEDDKPRLRRPTSPTLPDGDLPSYMKATESYFKKVEHLFEDEIGESKPKKSSTTKPFNEDELPSFMKPTKAFEALVAISIDETATENKPKRRSTVAEGLNGELPSYMKSTKSSDKHNEEDNLSADKKQKSSSSARLMSKSSPLSSKTHSENGDIPPHTRASMNLDVRRQSRDLEQSDEHSVERRKSQSKLSNAELPSFMKPTKSFEIRDRHNEEAMLQHEQQQSEPERKVSSSRKPRASLVDGEVPSYMKNTVSHVIREQTIATGTPESDSFDRAMEGPMIDEIPEPTPTPATKSRKSSVGGFLRKKFGLGKGTSVDSVSSSNAAASKTFRKSSSTKISSPSTPTATSKAFGNNNGSGDVPSYMKPTSNSSQRKISESLADEGEINLNMTTTMSAPSMNGNDSKTPIIKVMQVSIDGEDHDVPLRGKKTPSKVSGKDQLDPNTPPRSSIANRSASLRVRGAKAQSLLASLQVNGEEGWKRRVGEKDHGSFRSGSIHDRLTKIEDNSKSWQKKKGQENDAKQFTVEGKMAKKGDVKVAPSPLMPRKERVGGGAAKRANSLRLKREDDKTPSKTARPVSMQTPKRAEAKETTVVQVPDNDDNEHFFACTSTQEDIEVTAEDFDHIFIESASLLPSITKIKPKRNKASSSLNPYKALQMRQDIKSEYTETKSDIAEVELKRANKTNLAEKASRTALAGLATKEDINKISLKKANLGQVMNPGGMSAAPYKDLMLIQIKGRRHVEMRLVQPTAKSVNSGDCFLLVTKNKIYQWMGELANVMERSKAADLATYIVTKKDLGCAMAKSVTVIEEAKQVGTYGNEFWKLLGGSSSYPSSGPVEEDELYEDYMAETNSVFRVNGDDLNPIEEYSGQIPRYDMLSDDQVLVFDFGTEVYAWCGKLASMDQRKAGLKLAKLLFQAGYDYTDYDINPMSPLSLPDQGGLPKKSSKRPDWAICGKVTANMETLLFKEKFYDWPEASRLIQTKDVGGEPSTTVVEELKAFDAKSMLERADNPVTLVLENSNVGRGQHWLEYEDGLRREYQIDTLGVRMWHVSASDYYELMEDSYGQLHSGDTYVVRWQYQVKQSGVRNLKGNLSKHQTQMGRERCAYFFWQGAQSTINEKGASALMTVELDEEHGPQVRVEQGLEPACFLSLFNGHMITHLGKRDDDEKKISTKLYVLQHEHEQETSLHEVPCRIESLRSRGVFVHINIKTAVLYLWFGCSAPKDMKNNGRRIASWISDQCPMEIGLSLESSVTIKETSEGDETAEFLTAIRSNNRTKYDCMLNAAHSRTGDYVPRLFHMTSVNLVFHVQEVYSPSRNEHYSAFPFVQSQLYKHHQPTVFLLDFGADVYLWQGWWPLGSEEEENLSTGSARSRYTSDRKLALETSINYCKARSGKIPNMYCVYAGKEPLSFTNHFAEWEVCEEAVTANTLENRPSTLEDMKLCFQRLSKSVYTFNELQQRPLPDGVNPNRLETYLSDKQFNEVLKMSRQEFASLPGWKQTNIRKESKLF